jgi:hypothetical protein
MASIMAQPVAVTAAATKDVSMRERRRRPRTAVPPMYSAIVVRVLNKRHKPIEGHALNLSVSGIAVELDDLVEPGSPVTVEFSVSGLGRERAQAWPTFAATAEVVRNQDVDDFPGGPYCTALKFVRIPSIAQAQIARYIATYGRDKE